MQAQEYHKMDTQKANHHTASSMSMDSFAAPLKIIVGKEKREFFIQKDLICHHSKFFKAACDERWESGRTNTVTLEEDEPVIFSIFLTWVITGSLEKSLDLIQPCLELPVTIENKLKAIDQSGQLCECWVLGDVLDSEGFKNSTIDVLIAQTHRFAVATMTLLVLCRSTMNYI